MSDFLEIINTVFTYKLFELNRNPVSISSILMFLMVVGVFYFGSNILKKVLAGKILIKLNLDKGTQFVFIRIIHYIIMTIGAVVAFQFVGVNLSGLAVIFGFLSVGIGFGLQNVTSNFIAGLILLFERPINVGDRVTIGDTNGDIMEINIRSTTIRTLQDITYIVPNSEFISSTVVNWSHGDPKVRIDVEVGVSYDSDLDKVIKVLKQVAVEHPKVLKKPEPEVYLWEFGDSSWNMKLLVWIKDPYHFSKIKSEINCSIVRHFRENNIEIPFPQRDVNFKNAIPQNQ